MIVESRNVMQSDRKEQARPALTLLDSLGLRGAIFACRTNGWDGVLDFLIGGNHEDRRRIPGRTASQMAVAGFSRALLKNIPNRVSGFSMYRNGYSVVLPFLSGYTGPRRLARAALVSGAMAFVAACASTGPEKMSEAEISREASFQRQLALEQQVETQRRIKGVSFRLMVAAAEFCDERKTYGYGFILANNHSFGKEMTATAEKLYGLDASAQILSVTPGSPAYEAGLIEGDVIARVNGKPVAAGRDSVATVSRFLETSGSTGVDLEIAGPNPRRVRVAPVPVCGYAVEVMNSDKVNAYADGQRIRITRGVLWFVNQDAELAMVLAHELAHNVMGHAGTLRSFFDDKKSREADADYVGLFIMARAGFEIEKAPNFWRRIAATFPRMIDSSASHPIMPYRFVAHRKATEEIRRMEADGLPLVPRRVKNLASGSVVAVLPER